ncbi:MAG: lysophospholipid acyltransferase family protein [Armatimonadaceae bacterium]
MARKRSGSLQIQQALVWLVPRLIRKVGTMPRAKALAWGRRLGRVGHRFAKKARRATDRNLAFAFPEMPPAERAALSIRCFEHWGAALLDFLKGITTDPKDLLALVTSQEGMEHARPYLESKAGIVAVGAHLGSLELFARFVAAQGVQLAVVTRDPDDPGMRSLVKQLRESGGFITVDRNRPSGLRTLFRTLADGGVAGILPDQNASDIFVPFFGAPAGVADGAAALALKTGCVVIPAFCLRNPDDTYRVIVREPIVPNQDADRDTEIRRITTEFTNVFEEVIRSAPEQYLWLHSRWRASFDESSRSKWPAGYDFDTLKAKWESGG